MKKFATVILLVLFGIISATAQDTKTDHPSPIDDNYYPTNNSDFHYFFLRKNSRLSEGLVGYEMDFHQDRVSSKSKFFIPLVNRKKWNYVIPIYYDRHQFTSASNEMDINTEYRNFFFQSVLNYYSSEKLTFTSIIEGRIRGNAESHFESRGNMLAHYFVVKYQLSNQLFIAPAILAGHQWNVDNEFVFFPSLELKWNPNKDFALMAGVPGLLGIEWSMAQDIDVVMHSMMDNGVLTVNASARKRFNDYFEFSLHYDQDGYGNTYLPSNIVNSEEGESYHYNQVNQKENSISAKLTFKPTKEVLLQVKGGYNYNSELTLSNNDTEQVGVKGEAGFYSGIAAYWRFTK